MICTDLQKKINLMNMRPARVMELLTEAIDRKTWHESTHSENDKTGRPVDRTKDMPWWYPVREVINGKDKAIGRAARSVVVGTQWTQARLFYANTKGVHEPTCQACDEQALGTLHHRHRCCKAYRWIRNEEMSIASQTKMREGVGGNIMATHGLMMKRELPEPPAYEEVQPEWANDSAPRIFRGTVYTDCSGILCRWFKEFFRAAWAAVIMSDNASDLFARTVWDVNADSEQTDSDDGGCGCRNSSNACHKCSPWCIEHMGYNNTCGKKKKHRNSANTETVTKPCQALSGPLNGPVQTVPRAELEAIAQVLENGIGPLCIDTDHRNHVLAWEKGRRYCIRPKGHHVDIWRRIWKRIAEIRNQGGTVELKWIRSHQRAARNESYEDTVNREGNDAADW